MSFTWIKPAYETRLGNSTAKCVLVLIADQANAEGYGHPSLEFIARNTEVSMRTVRRVVQVFIELELISKVDRGPKHMPGFQLNTALLGADLQADYALHLHAAEGRGAYSEELIGDASADVSQTGQAVSQTGQVVSQTIPPHPLYCVPLKDPVKTLPHSPHEDIACEQRSRRIQERLARGRAIDAVMQACGFTDDRLSRTLRIAIRQEADKGEAPGTTALAMISAWQSFTSQAERLRYRWGARRFFAEGYWHKPKSWPWDASALRDDARRTEARLGSYSAEM